MKAYDDVTYVQTANVNCSVFPNGHISIPANSFDQVEFEANEWPSLRAGINKALAHYNLETVQQARKPPQSSSSSLKTGADWGANWAWLSGKLKRFRP